MLATMRGILQNPEINPTLAECTVPHHYALFHIIGSRVMKSKKLEARVIRVATTLKLNVILNSHSVIWI